MDRNADRHGRPLPKRFAAIGLLPNLVTILAVCAGLSALRYAFDGHFGLAVLAIGLAAACDALDGRIARILKTESALGAELDSLGDFLNFGVVPAIVIYLFDLRTGPGLGWVAVLIYTVACMLRLARFNIGSRAPSGPAEAKGFIGVPSPAGAMLVLAPIYLAFATDGAVVAPSAAVAIWMILCGALMISRIPTPAVKHLRVSADGARFLLVGGAGLVAALLSYPWVTLLVLDLAYLATVLVIGLRGWLASRRVRP